MKKYTKALAAGMIAMMCLTACGGGAAGTGATEQASGGASTGGKADSA